MNEKNYTRVEKICRTNRTNRTKLNKINALTMYELRKTVFKTVQNLFKPYKMNHYYSD